MNSLINALASLEIAILGSDFKLQTHFADFLIKQFASHPSIELTFRGEINSNFANPNCAFLSGTSVNGYKYFNIELRSG
jgi:hypothetical protein